MAKVTRTYGPIHFEDLDPHRFEDLIRELTYDYKDWQSIEATGRGGADGGFDIRAYERISPGQTVAADSEDAEEQHPMEGNRWMTQCKREKDIGPKRLLKILDDVDAGDPPYGYILAAATNFSKQSYDAFRARLIEKGVMEFHLWGKAELEDMLHQPKNDRILFTFFGISLVTRRRSRSTEIRFAVNNKNKLFRILGEQIGHPSVLLRDANDNHYPFKGQYNDFDRLPRWKVYTAAEYHPHGLELNISRYFAYIDVDAKEFDFTEYVSLLFPEHVSNPFHDMEAMEKQKREQEKREAVQHYWDHLPNRNKANFHQDGLVRFDDMLVIDEKGNSRHKFPHIYVEFEGASGPFFGTLKYLTVSHGYGEPQTHSIEGWKRIEVFPPSFEKPQVGTIYTERTLQLDPSTHAFFINGNESVREFFDLDGTYEFLEPRDVIALAKSNGDKSKDATYVQITYVRKIAVKDYVEGPNREYQLENLERRVGKKLNDADILTVFEFKRAFEWEFNRADRSPEVTR